MKRILIAHQSTIPHYRIPFYNSLGFQKPDNWQFDVVFDFSELETPRFFKEEINPKEFSFSTLNVYTFHFSLKGKVISYQTFLRQAASYDLIILEYAINNLSYPLCQFLKPFGVKIAFWGHGRDRSINNQSFPNRFKQKFKLMLAKESNGFFAYTKGSMESLESQGLSSEKIIVVNNTIDVNEQRRNYLEIKQERESIRKQKGLMGKKVLIFVGRFNKDKRVDFLIEAFKELQLIEPSYFLILIGDKDKEFQLPSNQGILYLDSIIDIKKLGRYYIVSDLYVIPGAVGLGPLQALCYDLPILTIDSSTHGPEFEYLSSRNSIVLDSGSTPKEYANTIHELFNDDCSIRKLRENAWASINHLTIENMAQNFISGVNKILEQ